MKAFYYQYDKSVGCPVSGQPEAAADILAGQGRTLLLQAFEP
jgi:hypothetical protein